MDPTRYLTQIYEIHYQNQLKKYYRKKQIQSPKMERRSIMNHEKLKKYTLKLDALTLPENLANPLKNVSTKFTPLQIIMANIDSVYNLTMQDSGYLAPQYIKNFDIADITGTSIDYFQYRVPTTRFFTTMGRDYLDNRQVNMFSDIDFSEKVRSVSVNGMDLIVDTTTEKIKDRVIRIFKLCKVGGSCICLLDEITPEMFYIFSLCFESVSLFQPMAEDLNINNFYLIGENFLGSANDWIQILSSKDELNFNVEYSVNEYLNYFLDSYEKLINELSQELDNNDTEIYNAYKCKALWNIF